MHNEVSWCHWQWWSKQRGVPIRKSNVYQWHDKLSLLSLLYFSLSWEKHTTWGNYVYAHIWLLNMSTPWALICCYICWFKTFTRFQSPAEGICWCFGSFQMELIEVQATGRCAGQWGSSTPIWERQSSWAGVADRGLWTLSQLGCMAPVICTRVIPSDSHTPGNSKYNLFIVRWCLVHQLENNLIYRHNGNSKYTETRKREKGGWGSCAHYYPGKCPVPL